MTHKLLFKIFLVLAFSSVIFAQQRPAVTFNELLEQSENNPVNKSEARLTALELNQPWSIYTENGIFIEALAVEGNKPVYAVITNLTNPYDGGYTSFYPEVASKYDLSKARIIYSQDNVVNPHIGQPEIKSTEAASFIMFLESTNDRVVGIDPVTGDVVNANFFSDANLGTPKIARLTPRATITVSAQVSDGVLEYDTIGTYRQYFAPLGGVNNAILDNCRGHIYKPNGNLLVANGSGANGNTVVEFDNAGNLIGNLVAAGAGSIDSPYDIVWRTTDMLVGASSSHAIHKYDHNGNSTGTFASGVPFPQQLLEMPNGDVYCADFGVGGGVKIFDSNGSLKSHFSVVTANRGVWPLQNGNILTSNGGGLHEIDGSTGAVIRTIISGVSGQWFSPYDREIFIPVELVSFNADLQNGNVNLNWVTATETNNRGFEVERKLNNGTWASLAFIKGNGTTTGTSTYNYIDAPEFAGKYSYRLKQIDFDGTFEYSNIIEVDYSIPVEFSLEQNYPNPFNPSTKISFSIPSDEFVSLKVYNVLGKEVSMLLNQNLKAGSYDVDFNADNLTSGVYFYKIEAGKFNSIKKMLLIR